MVKGSQGITTTAKNPNAKYKYTVVKRQTITGNDNRVNMKYTYSKLITLISPKKYAYAI